MEHFFKKHFIIFLVILLMIPSLAFGIGNRQIWRSQIVGFATPGVASVLAAQTDTGSQVVITTGILPINIPGRITATSGGTSTAIKDIQVVLAGTDHNGTAIAETLPIFTENSATTVTGVKIFATVTSITIPAHDDVTATTSIGVGGSPAVADADGIMSALTDDGAEAVITTGTSINGIDVPRAITATSGGTGTDIAAIQVVLAGTDFRGEAIAETLPIFTENSATTVTGAKAFKEVTSITIPAHDDTGATTSIGFADIVGLEQILKRATVNRAYLGNAVEGTAPTITVNATDIESNTALLNTTLNSTQVIIDYMETPE